jgi:acetoin utilization deacetylase AcuC-like enzyme
LFFYFYASANRLVRKIRKGEGCSSVPQTVKVVFHEIFLETYTGDPAASRGRLDYTLSLVREKYTLVKPRPCNEEDVLLVHRPFHLEDVRRDEAVFQMALWSAGATIAAADLAWNGEIGFALCRPPGHHASPEACWGFCYFNNVAIAVQKLLTQGKIEKALIIDIDLHYGDGTSNIFAASPAVAYWHVRGKDRVSFVQNVKDYLEDVQIDLLAVSAGFDRHLQDRGGCKGVGISAWILYHCRGISLSGKKTFLTDIFSPPFCFFKKIKPSVLGRGVARDTTHITL